MSGPTDSRGSEAPDRLAASPSAAADPSSTAAADRPSATWHRITAPDADSRVGYCSACRSEVRIQRRKSGSGREGWRCARADKRRSRGSKTSPASRRRWALRAKFGLSEADYDALLRAQNGVCAICEQTCLTGRNLAVDHDHGTGRIRGLLCNQCNRAIGLLRDDVARLSRAIAYLN